MSNSYSLIETFKLLIIRMIKYNPHLVKDCYDHNCIQLDYLVDDKIRIYHQQGHYIVWYWVNGVCIGFEEYYDFDIMIKKLKYNIYKYEQFQYNLLG